MADFRKLRPTLRWLSRYGFLSGSYGRGALRGNDIDVYLPPRYVTLLHHRLNAQQISFYSPFPLSMTWIVEGTQVEVSALFPRYRNGPKTVEGVRFKT